jgi:hypothetical protein
MDSKGVTIEYIDDVKPLDSIDSDLEKDIEIFDPKVEAAIRRKYDMRILPIVTMVYLLAFIDR